MNEPGSTIYYSEMDPDSPPPGIAKLETCPNCGSPAVLALKGKWWIYIHSAWVKTGRQRHYCKLSGDGTEVEVVMPVLPAADAMTGG